MRILFLGTPDFAVPTLEALQREHEVVLAVAQPDRPAGRGMKMQAPAVAVRARELGIPLLQPPKIRTAEFLDAMRDLAPDIGIVIAYGRILPAALLEIPKHGFLNVHGSVLPRWRGAAPIQRAIEAGDRVTGVTIMRVDEELDHGPMLAIETLEIEPDERTPQLAKRLSELGARALLPVLRDVEGGLAVETPQEHDKATLAPKIEKSEGAVTFAETTAVIYNRFRAFHPWPGITLGELKLTEIRPVEDRRAYLSGQAGSPVLHPRTVLSIEEDVVVATADGAIRILEMQRPGKPRTPAGAVARGLGWRAGELLP